MKNSDMPAHPIAGAIFKNGCRIEDVHGLSKREYMAGLAMQGLLAADTNDVWSSESCAEAAVKFADTLLARLGGE